MPHQIRIKVRGYHLDVFQHVNNARYLEFLEEARWTYFDDHGLTPLFMASGYTYPQLLDRLIELALEPR